MSTTTTIPNGSSSTTADQSQDPPADSAPRTVNQRRRKRRSGTIIFAIMAMMLSTVSLQTATTEPAAAQGYCDAGYTLIGSTCYKCPAGYTRNHTSCSKQACPSRYSTNYGGWGNRACRRYVRSGYWSGYVYSYKTTQYVNPYTAPKRSFTSAVGNAVTAGYNRTVDVTAQGAIDTYTSSAYYQNNCSSFGWGWVLKPAGYVYTYMCMAYANYG